MDQVFELSTQDRFETLLQHKTQLAKSNGYYHSIHPTEAAEVDGRLAEEKQKAEAKAKADAEAKAKAAAAAAATAVTAPTPVNGNGNGAPQIDVAAPMKAPGKVASAEPPTTATEPAKAT